MRALTWQYWRQGGAAALLGCVCLLVSGCWDLRELQARHFVVGVAIDAAPAVLETGEKNKTFQQISGTKRYQLSLQLMEIKPRQGEQSGEGGKRTYVISNTGQSLFEMVRDMLGQVGRSLWFEHIQMIVISQAALEEAGVEPIVDFFRRDAEMRWRIKLLITGGQAKDILEYQPPSGEAGGVFFANTVRLYARNPHIPGNHADLGDVIQDIANRRSILLPRIEKTGENVKISGTAVIKNGRLKGYLDEYATQGQLFLQGEEKSAIISVECPKHPSQIIAFELFEHDTQLQPDWQAGQLIYRLQSIWRGNVAEVQCACEKDMQDSEAIKAIEEAVAREVERNMMYAFTAYQRLQVDPGIFQQRLQIAYPAYWKEIKPFWEEAAFPQAVFQPNVTVQIRNIGEHR